MPNWCENKVTVSGEPEQVKKFKEFVSDGKNAFSFNKITPMPPELLNDERWHDWRNKHWGCKWDTGADEITVSEYDDDMVEYSFLTPWGPPEMICKKLRETFPDLHINWFYHEPLMLLVGYL